MYVHGERACTPRRVAWCGACETVGRFRPRMPSLGACGAVGPEIRVEVLRQLVFEMCLLFLVCGALRSSASAALARDARHLI